MAATSKYRGRLFRKYIVLFVGVACAILIANGLLDTWFSYREQKSLLVRIQREQAEAAAAKIGQSIKEIQGQMGWTTDRAWTAGEAERRYLDARRLLRQVPAITELALVDSSGREQLRVSRLAQDAIGSGTDLANERKFKEAVASKVYHGPVYFRHDSEPYMTIALAGARREAGVGIAEVNLHFIQDTISQIKAGSTGHAYVVDAQNRLIAHPDISLVLRNIDLSRLAAVHDARSHGRARQSAQELVAENIQGRRVLTAHAPIDPLGWFVFVEIPVEEAFAPLYASIRRSAALVLAALVVAFFSGLFLARRMVVPIRTLRAGAERLGGGDLGQRISIRTGDELEALGEQFNRMAEQIQDSYATLERKVEERTDQLKQANLAKSRFLAAASHDLRQPLHALGLFVAQLRTRLNAAERSRVVDRIDSATAAMNELFNALLDISKLDAGVLAPDVADFPVAHVLNRIEATFADVAREKGLSLRIVSSAAWMRTDFILIERILLNLVSNAVRYTDRGGIVVGCRRRGASVRIEVWDSGRGIPEDQRRNIFTEFYRLAGSQMEAHGGLGLGLAIVERLCALLGHAVELSSIVGKGSRFAVVVPAAAARTQSAPAPTAPVAPVDSVRGKIVVVIDDDALVREGMSALLQGWGCRVLIAASTGDALTGIAQATDRPDLIISDFHLSDGTNGIEVIERIRQACHWAVPAFLISGDVNPDRMLEVRERGYHVLHKPVPPMALRAMLTRAMTDQGFPIAA